MGEKAVCVGRAGQTRDIHTRPYLIGRVCVCLCGSVFRSGEKILVMPLPFEQQPGESGKAFEAFSVYLSMGQDRSTEAVAKTLSKSCALVRRWAARWQWLARVQSHADHFAKIERQATEAVARCKGLEWLKRQQVVREEEWELHDELLRAGREAIKRFHERGKGATLGDIARLLELASKLGRLSSGMATDRTEITGEDGGPIQAEVTVALEKIYGAVLDVAPVGGLLALPAPEAGAVGLPGERATGSPVAGGGELTAETRTPSKP